ncbi:MAG: hypothetical protein QOC77_3544 [Thermoleophilaceae bacterium]|jgi:uncharacterized protein (DUF427 family)|nr:hypothetical protein [Thermoleophilaceae bacterium]
MSLTLGTAPFSSKRRGLLNSRIEGPAHLLYFEPYERRMRALQGGETVIDTTAGMLLYESNIGPVLYVPEADVRADLLERTDHTTYCPFKGDATYWSAGAAENAIWGYEQPIESASFLLGYMAPYWHMFEWYEEDERLHTRLRDPYHRIDVRETDARVTVRAGGEVVAESDRPLLLFETGIRPRAYLPLDDVRRDLLAPSEKQTVCPYKGTASYWSVGGAADAAWSYRDPIPEAGAIEGLVSFDGDGVEVEIKRPRPSR